ncbi:DUF2142 domain-containing protein [Occultella aeris]|uniref:Dolichyl-phosphate-mannose-protein mannosyltransferase n=1 Tax=Occultella aeris TaxID=2761496 RepID=A0A7M4DL20_9MICO|nr:DUF2142 domain-containing protein [Occultella aeris]VZO37910.1 Dolichyl-phosphate-mannose-protein mannosyltransferase [Occultella aeris]
MTSRNYRRTLAVITALLGVVMVLWAVLTPGFRAPDEPQHFNSVMRVATGGGWPAPGEARVSDATLIATREAGLSLETHGISVLTSSILPRSSLQGWGYQFVDLTPLPAQERSVLDHTADLVTDVEPTYDQMTQHPPLFYAAGAVLIRAFGALDWRWDQQLLLLRLFCVFLCIWVVPLTAATTRMLTGKRTVALAAAVSILAIPQFAHIGAAVSNDSLTNLLGAVLLTMAAAIVSGRVTWARLVAIGVALGLALLTKGFLLAAVPMVALAVVIGARALRPRERLWRAFVTLVVAFVVGGWWWLRNLLVHGALQPSGMPPFGPDWGDDTPTVREFAPQALDRFATSFWGNFGFLEIALLRQLTLGLTVLGLAALVAGVIACRRRLRLIVLLTLPVGTLLVVLGGTFASYQTNGLFAGLQGRYLFSSIAVLAAAAWIGLDAIARRLGRRWTHWLPVLATLFSVTLAAVGLITFFQACYQLPSESVIVGLNRWALWSIAGRTGVGLAVLAPLVVAITLLVVLVVGSLRRSRRPDLARSLPA